MAAASEASEATEDARWVIQRTRTEDVLGHVTSALRMDRFQVPGIGPADGGPAPAGQGDLVEDAEMVVVDDGDEEADDAANRTWGRRDWKTLQEQLEQQLKFKHRRHRDHHKQSSGDNKDEDAAGGGKNSDANNGDSSGDEGNEGHSQADPDERFAGRGLRRRPFFPSAAAGIAQVRSLRRPYRKRSRSDSASATTSSPNSSASDVVGVVDEDMLQRSGLLADAEDRELRVKRTCGRVITVRVRTLLTCAISLLTILFAICVVVPTGRRINAVQEKTAGAFDAALSDISTAILSVVAAYQSSNAQHIISKVENALVERVLRETMYMVDQTQVVLRSRNWTSSPPGAFPPRDIELDLPALVAGWSASIGPELLSTFVLANNPVTSALVVGYSTRQYLSVGRFSSDRARVTTVRFGTTDIEYRAEVDTHSSTINYGTLYTVPPRLAVTQTSWYNSQVAIAANRSLSAINAVGWPVWTPMYNIAPSNENSTRFGLSYSLPILPCGNYSCLAGVVSGHVERDSLDIFARSQLGEVVASFCTDSKLENDQLLFEACQPERRVLFFALATEDSADAYVVSSSLESTSRKDEPPSRASTHENPLIRQAWNFYVWSAKNEGTEVVVGEPFNSTIRISGDLEELGDPIANRVCDLGSLINSSGVFQLDRVRDCYVVTVAKIDVDSRLRTVDTNTSILELITVSVIPYRLYLRDVPMQFERSSANFDEENERIIQELHKSNTQNGITAAIFVILAIAFSLFLSYHIDRPLAQVRQSIHAIEDFDFDRPMVRLQAGSRITEVFQVQRALAKARETIEVFGKFIPRAVVRRIVRNEDRYSRRLHVKRRTVTIMFSDIAGFTTLSEVLPIKDLLFLLTKYLTVMCKIVESYQGVVGEILGDGLLAFWNTPSDVESHAALACAAALAQQASMALINEEFGPLLSAHNLPRLTIRVGIHTGPVLTGNLGSVSKMKFGCLGDTINLASRVEGICKLYGVPILCTGDTFVHLPPGSFEFAEIDLVTVKGKSAPTRLFHILSMPGTMVVNCSPSTAQSFVVDMSERNQTQRADSRPRAEPGCCSCLSCLPCQCSPCESDPVPADEADLDDTEVPQETPSSAGGMLRLDLSKLRRVGANGLPQTSSLQRFTRHASFLPKVLKKLSRNSESGMAQDERQPMIRVGPIGEQLEGDAKHDAEAYLEALRSYQAGFFALACRAIARTKEPTRASEFLEERAKQALETYGPHCTTWDGVLNLTAKEF